MAEPLADRVIRRIGQAAELYHRLVMLVAPAGAGKTAALQDVHERTAVPLVNVNLELSRRMLDLSERQRALQLPRLLSEIVSASAAEVILLDNVEVLFDVSLKQDPLRLLQGLSRNKTVVAAWSGEIRTGGRGLRTEINNDDSSLITHHSVLITLLGLCDAGPPRIQTISHTRFLIRERVKRRTSSLWRHTWQRLNALKTFRRGRKRGN
ncbi:MAG TPA: BREX-3 system P-loop-containing protein BrxF [Dissulfurispiraceae bacterium]|nr:BREX-3 system P-loop-containing protein BrxF [Dissulfurispiraceae bacterium]